MVSKGLPNLAAAPIAAVFFYFASGHGDDVVYGAAATAAVFAALYTAVAAFTGTDLRTAAGAYLLAALLTVPWVYGILFAALIYTCSYTSDCPFR